MKTIKAGIIGGAGYAAGELLRVLLNHPQISVAFVLSRSQAGRPVSSVHTDLLGDTELRFCDSIDNSVDVVFFCLAHGESSQRIGEIAPAVKIIDLSQDFRVQSHPDRKFVYGLPELHRDTIKRATHIANPGCFATAIQLGLLPLAKHQLISSDITVSCTTGSTGAGRELTASSHFSWRDNNLSVYKAFKHQHLAEILQGLKSLQPEFNNDLLMFPQRGSFTRGIFACISLKLQLPLDQLRRLYEDYFASHPFIRISGDTIDLKQVINTNKCFLSFEQNGDQVLIVSVIDNLLKGASGQAVQNMNLMFGLEETSGLKLKASVF